MDKWSIREILPFAGLHGRANEITIMVREAAMFIAVDGIDGAGKTTLAHQLAKVLSSFRPYVTKEPTNDSPWAREIRNAVIKARLTREKEVELFHLDRLYHIKNVILPTLQENRLVITDRYVDSTLAFQAESPTDADALYQQFLPDILVPDVTFILCCPVDIGVQRIARAGRDFTRFENLKDLEAAQAVYESRKGPHYAMLDASGTPEETLEQALDVLCERFLQLRPEIQCHSENTGSSCGHGGLPKRLAIS